MLLLFILASVGATTIVVYSSIFAPIRSFFSMDEDTYESIETKQVRPTIKQRLLIFFSTLIHCPLCFGFWMSAVMYLFIYGTGDYNLAIHFASACAGAAMSFLFKKAVE